MDTDTLLCNFSYNKYKNMHGNNHNITYYTLYYMNTASPTNSTTTYCVLNIDNNTESDVIKHHIPFLRDSSVKDCGIKIKLHRDYVREPDVIVYFQGELYNTPSILRILDMQEEPPVENMIIQLYKNMECNIHYRY